MTVGSWSLLGIGVLLLALFGLFYWLSIFATARAVLAFVGTALVGFTGFSGRVLAWLGREGARFANDLLGWAFGPAAAAIGGTVLVVVVGVIFVHDLSPKKTAGKRTGWAGVALAVLLLAGASGIPALNGIIPGVRSGVSTVRTIGG